MGEITIHAETDKAYLAGILDGDGCICISPKRRSKGDKVYIVNYLYVFISNSNPKLMEWLKSIGGSVVELKPGAGALKRTGPVFSWSISARQAGQFLTQVVPYLIIKKEQAEAAIYFQSLRKPHGKGRLRTELDDYLDGLLRNKVNVRGGK